MASFTNLQGLPQGAVPEPAAVKRWTNRLTPEDQAANQEPVAPVTIPAACEPAKLYPTHPSQMRKQYHASSVATYDARKVPADSEVCKVASRSSRPTCLDATAFEYVVVSDVFQDRCGNLYRGYEARGFLRTDENMGTLLSPGRTVYPRPGSEFDEYEWGGTYPVSTADLLLVGPPLPGDAEAVVRERAGAEREFNFDHDAVLFHRKPR